MVLKHWHCLVRELSLRRVSLHKIFWREVCVGLSLGLITGIPMGLFSYLWFRDFELSVTLVIAMTVNGLVSGIDRSVGPDSFCETQEGPGIGY